VTKWYADNSRYKSGFECPWRRLVGYHANTTGYSPHIQPSSISTGLLLHEGLEQLMLRAQKGPVDRQSVNNSIAGPALGPPQILDAPLTKLGAAELTGLLHAYARGVLPWLLENYDIVSTEEEFSLDVGDDIIWMARPDCVVRSKTTGLPSIVEFKTTAAKADRMAAIYTNSMQTIMNSYAVSQKYGQPCESAQIHLLQLGTEQWPTAITHAYYRPGNPPYTAEDWQPTGRGPSGQWLGKLYRRVAVHEHRPTDEWVWAMPESALSNLVPVVPNSIDPKVQGLRVMQALDSIRSNENWWRTQLAKVDWDKDTGGQLSASFPRTFACTQYNRECQFYSYCFDPDNYNITLGRPPIGFQTRIPHHPQEGELDL